MDFFTYSNRKSNCAASFIISKKTFLSVSSVMSALKFLPSLVSSFIAVYVTLISAWPSPPEIYQYFWRVFAKTGFESCLRHIFVVYLFLFKLRLFSNRKLFIAHNYKLWLSKYFCKMVYKLICLLTSHV